MAFDVSLLFAAVIDPARRLGVFDRVNQYEPKSAPGNGITASYFLEAFAPLPAKSGVDRTAMLLVWQCRIQSSMLADPPESIDPNLLDATAKLLLTYHGDFDLSTSGITGVELDLLGAYWPNGCASRAAYVSQDSVMYRAQILSIPLVINDVFVQVR